MYILKRLLLFIIYKYLHCTVQIELVVLLKIKLGNQILIIKSSSSINVKYYCNVNHIPQFYKNHFYKNTRLKNAQNLRTYPRLRKGRELLHQIVEVIYVSAVVCQYNIASSVVTCTTLICN